MKLLKCIPCKKYTLKENCSKCGKKTTSAHYIFPTLRNEPSRRERNFKRR